MINKMVSIVIPVYNVEKYLSECLDSVINQTYKNLQIILVDDGSTDNSGKICDEYAQKDNRIQVVHQQNAGAGAAKNAGLELIEGEYLSLIDSDDWLDIDFYETMVSEMEQNHVDIVQCMFKSKFVNYEFIRKYCFGFTNKIMLQKDFLFEYLYDWKYSIFWNKLFKTELLKDIRFPVGRKIDDEFFTYKLVCNSKRVLCIDKPMYNYRMRSTSVMKSNNTDRLIMDRIDCFVERYDIISKKFISLKPYYYNALSKYILSYLSSIDGNRADKKVYDYANKFKSNRLNNYTMALAEKIKLKNFVPDQALKNENYICFE